MMPNSHIAKTEVAQNIFGVLDHPQFLGCHRFAGGDARTQAGHLRFVCRGQSHLRRQLANLRLRQADFFHRRAHLEFRRRLRAGPEIPDVAGIFAVTNHREIFRARDGREFLEQLVLAKITTVERIGEVAGIVKLRRLHHADGKMKLLAKLQGLREFAARQAGGIGDDGQRAFAQLLMRHAREEHGIHPAGVGDNT